MTVIIGKTGVSPDAILYVADDETAGGDRHGIAAGVRHGLDQLGIGVVTRKFHSGQVKDHRVMTLIGNSGGAAGNRELHAQAGLILPFAGDGLKVMTGSVCIHIDIVCHIAGSVRQRFLVQRLLHIHLPALSCAEGGDVAIAGIIDMADRNRHAAAAARGILTFENQVAVIQADMTHASTAHILILVDQIIFQTGQGNVVDGYIRLVVSMIAGVQLKVGTAASLKSKAIVGPAIPLAHQIGDVVGIPSAVRGHVLIIQRLVAQRRRIVIGNGLAAPAAQHFLQKNGGGRGGRALGHDREVRLGDIVRGVNRRQPGIKELDKGLAGAPVGAAVGDRHTRTGIGLHGRRLSAGNKVILNGGGMFLADDSRVQCHRELCVGKPGFIRRIGHMPDARFARGNQCAANCSMDALGRAVLHKRGRENIGGFTRGSDKFNIAILRLFRGEIRSGENEGYRPDRLSGREDQLVLKGQRLNTAEKINAREDVAIDRLILQMRQHVAAKIASTMLAAGPAYTHGSDILSVFQTPGQQTVIVVLHKDGGHITGGMKLNVELVIGTVGQIHAAGRVGHRDEGVIDLLPLTGSLAVVMHGIGKEYRLVQAAAKVENLAGTGALFTVFPTGHALHFFRADGGVKRLSNNRRFMVHIFHDSKFLSWCCDWIGIS